MLNMNMKVLLVANKYFSTIFKIKDFCVTLKYHLTTTNDFVGKHSIVKPDVSWADICNFSSLFLPIFS